MPDVPATRQRRPHPNPPEYSLDDLQARSNQHGQAQRRASLLAETLPISVDRCGASQFYGICRYDLLKARGGAAGSAQVVQTRPLSATSINEYYRGATGLAKHRQSAHSFRHEGSPHRRYELREIQTDLLRNVDQLLVDIFPFPDTPSTRDGTMAHSLRFVKVNSRHAEKLWQLQQAEDLQESSPLIYEATARLKTKLPLERYSPHPDC